MYYPDKAILFLLNLAGFGQLARGNAHHVKVPFGRFHKAPQLGDLSVDSQLTPYGPKLAEQKLRQSRGRGASALRWKMSLEGTSGVKGQIYGTTVTSATEKSEHQDSTLGGKIKLISYFK